jgi:amino acid permease
MRASGLAVGQIRGKSFFAENSPETPGTLTTSGAVLGIISTILGGGMVGIPWAIYSQGFVLGIGVSAFAAI